MYPHNNTTIRRAWTLVENGNFNLLDFIRNVSYTPEQIIRNHIGKLNLQHRKLFLIYDFSMYVKNDK